MFNKTSDVYTMLIVAGVVPAEEGIELQEAQGQRDIIASVALPKKITNRDVGWPQLAKEWGFKEGDNRVPSTLFISVILPEGWTYKDSDHNMHSYIYDATGAKRIAVFYKAAVYDMRADRTLQRRYTANSMSSPKTNEDTGSKIYSVNITDSSVPEGKPGRVLQHIGEYDISSHYTAGDDMYERAKAWLREHYPDHENPFAYWDNPHVSKA